MPQTAHTRRSLPGMISGGTLEGAPCAGMRRREFVTLFGGAVAWPMVARAQQIPVVGFLGTSSADSVSDLLRAFHQGLAETGFTEGRNVALEYRWAEGKNERMPALANDLVSRNVTVIAASTTPAAQAAKAATAVIPTVFVTGTDPVAAKLVSRFEPARRQSHWGNIFGCRVNSEAPGAFARASPNGQSNRAIGESDRVRHKQMP